MRILGIETSCDETSAAVVRSGIEVFSCVVASSKNEFQKSGGVIPEHAARKQLESILPVIDSALKEAKITLTRIDAVAVTYGPGLLGSLLVGTSTARVLSEVLRKPLIPVHHTMGHLSSTWLIPPPSSPDPFSRREKGGPVQKKESEEKKAMNPQILEFARSMRNESTAAEEMLWKSLRNRKKGAKFRRQHPIHSRILDFYCEEYRLGIELDGGIHDSAERSLYDKERTEVLEEVGIRIIRFKNDEVLNNIQSVLARISEYLNSPLHPHPGSSTEWTRHPSPTGRGEGGEGGVRVGKGEQPTFPILTLSVSGGHTDLWYRTKHTKGIRVSSTLDDAAGEAFDKGATLFGLPYPGGPALAKLAEGGDEKKFPFPLPLRKEKTLDFSFSGLKTSLKYLLRDLRVTDKNLLKSVAASYQFAICRHLVDRLEAALGRFPDTREIHIVGGVSANLRLREMLSELGKKYGIQVRWPVSLRYCTDNAAMIAAAAYFMCEEHSDINDTWKTKATTDLAEWLVPA